MAKSITIAGTDYWASEGGEGDEIVIGESTRAFAGNLRNSVRDVKRTFTFTTVPITETDYDTLRAAVSGKAHVTVSGTLLSGDSITAAVRITSKLESGSSPTRWIVSGQGEEV